MYPIPPNEILVETRTCRFCSVSFPITDKDLEFYEKVSPVFNGKKYQIPPPTLCPDCRQQRRGTFLINHRFYKRKSSLSNTDIVSVHKPNTIYPVYSEEEWWSDQWNPLDYGKIFDAKIGFFHQLELLYREIPKQCNYNSQYENADYSSLSSVVNDIYLSSNIFRSSEIWYCERISWYSYSIADSFQISWSDNLYECIDSSKLRTDSIRGF